MPCRQKQLHPHGAWVGGRWHQEGLTTFKGAQGHRSGTESSILCVALHSEVLRSSDWAVKKGLCVLHGSPWSPSQMC